MAGYVCLLGLSWWATGNLGGTGPLGDPRAGVLLANGVLYACFCTGILLVIVLMTASVEGVASSRCLYLLPLSTRALASGQSLPALTAGMLLLVPTIPPLGSVVANLTDRSVVLGCTVVVGSLLAGLLSGQVLLLSARTVLSRLPKLASREHQLTLLAALVLLSVNFGWIRLLIDETIPADWSWIALPLMLPGVAAPLITGGTFAWLLAVLVLAALVSAIWWLFGRPSVLHIPRKSQSRLFGHRARPGRIGLYQVELLRLFRAPATRNSILAAVVLLIVLFGLSTAASSETRAGLAETLLPVAGFLAGMPALQARGLSRRHFPPTLIIGYGPARWAGAIVAASATVSIFLYLAFACALALQLQESTLPIAGLGTAMSATGLFLLASFVLIPRRGDTAAELAGAAIGVIGSLLFGQVASKLVAADDMLSASPMLIAVGCATLALPCVIESRRWSTSRAGTPSSPPSPPTPSTAVPNETR
ncbi:hypothetical protein [Streptomyces sp. NPDC093109]|uniref:hypothetical protein n=1 Tax=Streptomyces sp. NPDC093109 TaxID=3154977 RepID=UPI00344DC8C4